MKEQKVTSLQYDWIVSSDGGFTLSMTDDDESKLTFKVHYRRETILYEEAKGGKNEFTQDDIDWMNNNHYKLLTATFRSGWCYFAPIISYESKQLVREKYNWSEVFGLNEKGNIINQDDYLKEFNKKWLEEKICPDSAFYKIINSKWAEKVDPNNKWKLTHYLVYGHDYYAEFLTNNLWTSP